MSCRFKLITSKRDSHNQTLGNKSSIEFNAPVIKGKLSLVKAKITDRIFQFFVSIYLVLKYTHFIIYVSLPGEQRIL